MIIVDDLIVERCSICKPLGVSFEPPYSSSSSITRHVLVYERFGLNDDTVLCFFSAAGIIGNLIFTEYHAEQSK